MKALPIDACATENLSTLLANGATIDAFLKVSACPQGRAVDVRERDFFSRRRRRKEEDFGKTVRSAFAPVVEDYQDEKNGTVGNEQQQEERRQCRRTFGIAGGCRGLFRGSRLCLWYIEIRRDRSSMRCMFKEITTQRET